MGSVINLIELKTKLHGYLPVLKKKYPVEWLALFGSVTRNDFNPDKSDIDILVEFNGSIGIEFVDLADDLEKLTGQKVDLVSRGGLKPRQWEYLKDKLQYV